MTTAGRGAANIGRDLGLLAEGSATAGLSDGELVGRFLGGRGESADRAFAAIVSRHGPMVRRVCARALRDPGAASDAFQATFLVLARKAGSVRVGESLAPWLHGVSVRVARRARAVAARRLGRERTGLPLPEPARGDDRPGVDLDDLRAAIDEELTRLPGAYRSALVLFHLEGLSQEEAAGRLGCPVGTIRSRLARGRDLLRDRLTRRGFAPAGPATVVRILAERPPWPPLEGASAARTIAGLATACRSGGVVPPGLVPLVEGACRIMTMQKLAPFAALALSAAGVLGGLGLAIGQEPKPGPPQPGPPQVAPAGATPKRDADVDPNPFVAYPPFVVKTEPATGSVDVDPDLAQIRVTFSREMRDQSWSWVQLDKATFPKVDGQVSFDKDGKTCVAPVKLEPGKTYAIFLNSEKFTNFRSTTGQPAVPYLLVFKTKAAR